MNRVYISGRVQPLSGVLKNRPDTQLGPSCLPVFRTGRYGVGEAIGECLSRPADRGLSAGDCLTGSGPDWIPGQFCRFWRCVVGPPNALTAPLKPDLRAINLAEAGDFSPTSIDPDSGTGPRNMLFAPIILLPVSPGLSWRLIHYRGTRWTASAASTPRPLTPFCGARTSSFLHHSHWSFFGLALGGKRQQAIAQITQPRGHIQALTVINLTVFRRL